MAAVVAGIGELERVGAGDLELPAVVAAEPDAREGHRFVEELQVVALAGGAAGVHRALARAQAVNPKQNAEHDQHESCPFPHQRLSCFRRSAPFSATATTAALMFPEGTAGMTEASITRKPSTPFTLSLSSTTAPMLQVEVGWNTVSPERRQNSSQSSSLCTSAPGNSSAATYARSGAAATMRRTSFSPSTITRRSFSVAR